MKVRALKEGFYNNRRQKPGAVFIVKGKDHFSSKWMEEVKAEKKGKKVIEKPIEVNTDLNSEVI